ncbi:MAG: hypothetical protein WKF45_07930 [Ilumatobacteraceae bacterium]
MRAIASDAVRVTLTRSSSPSPATQCRDLRQCLGSAGVSTHTRRDLGEPDRPPEALRPRLVDAGRSTHLLGREALVAAEQKRLDAL